MEYEMYISFINQVQQVILAFAFMSVFLNTIRNVAFMFGNSFVYPRVIPFTNITISNYWFMYPSYIYVFWYFIVKYNF